MSTRPYTTADLRAEAARQHHTATRDYDLTMVGEEMADEVIPSTADDGLGGGRWRDLTFDDERTARRAVDALRESAADVSAWAINLGADGLEPSDEHAITVNGDGTPIARVHFAFEPDMTAEMRSALVEGIGNALANAL